MYLLKLNESQFARLINLVGEKCEVSMQGCTLAMDRSRRREHVRSRWVAWAVMSQYYEVPFAAIGRIFHADHTTVLHGMKGLEALTDTGETEYEAIVDAICYLLDQEDRAEELRRDAAISAAETAKLRQDGPTLGPLVRH